ncbi:MAG: extracellular solute-binding protein [Pseudomonadota bacterium]
MRGVKLSALALSAIAVAGLTVPAPVFAEDITIKLWSRADRSGQLRGGNIVRAADLLNKQFAAAGVDTTITVDVHENNAKGFDADALDLFKAFAADQGPDLYVAAHEWIGAFASDGYAANLEEHIAQYPEYYSDVIPVLWESTKHNGERYAIPQDSEIRMFFYNKDMLREIGKDEAFIEGLPEMVDSGEFTIYDLSNLTKEVVDAGVAEYGLVHRPNVGPDFLMSMASFGFDPFDEESGNLQASESALEAFFEWIAYNAENGITPEDNTSMTWDTINALLPEGKAFIKHHGIWDVPRQIKLGGWDGTEEDYFRRVGWLHSPAAEKGGTPANLSHPIVYAVNPNSEHKDLAALLIAIATQNYFNTEHAVTTAHTGVNHGQAAMPAYKEAWSLAAATPMLARSTFMPNHPDIGPFNAVIYTGIQGVETGRMDPKEATAFVLDELDAELGDKVNLVE